MPDNRDDMNLDYRLLTLLLACATRGDLLDDYINGKGAKLQALDLPETLLDQSRYVFEDPYIQDALRRTQVAFQTLVNINDYCEFACPVDATLQQLTHYTGQLARPLQPAGEEA